MSTTKTEAKLPESVKIGDSVYVLADTPELLQLVQTVSSIEKTKLYSKYEAMQKELAELKQLTPPSDISSIKEELIAAVTEKVDSMFSPIREQLGRQSTNFLEEYRKKLISENAEKCIPEMVKGDTKEELDASLAHSIEIRKKYSLNDNPLEKEYANQQNQKATIKTVHSEENPSAVNNAAAQTQSPSVTVPLVVQPEVSDELKKVKDMPLNEYAAKRESLFKQLETVKP